MITEKDLSKQLNRPIKSPIRIASLNDLNINQHKFISYYQPLFSDLENDDYLVKQKQIDYLKAQFPSETAAINRIYKDYYERRLTTAVLTPWLDKLSPEQQDAFKVLSTITRQRSIATFTIEKNATTFSIKRIDDDTFKQTVDDNSRRWERKFTPSSAEAVEHPLFNQLLTEVFKLVHTIHPKVLKLKITSHFMRTIAQHNIKGENSPEGMHEDGVPYIVSALVINRENITGAETQIFEKTATEKTVLFHKVLTVGEFAFQADTGEEKTFGNDLWHYVTPIQPIDPEKKGIRDIIGLDIEIIN